LASFFASKSPQAEPQKFSLDRHLGEFKVKINELQSGTKRVDIEASVVEKGSPRQVQSRFSGETLNVADAMIQDETGTIKLTLWNEQIDMVNVGDNVKIENGYVTSFKGENQLNIGKYGKLTVL
jgi:replication factor A1